MNVSQISSENGPHSNFIKFVPVRYKISKAQIHKLRVCSYGQKLSRLARKLFDKFTSEISPCYENNMKSYIAFI